jgi:hypothetical protein
MNARQAKFETSEMTKPIVQIVITVRMFCRSAFCQPHQNV